MRKWFPIIFYLIFSTHVSADYFKWEILLVEKGFGPDSQKIPIASEGKIDFENKKINCRTEDYWTRIESDLLIEGKTLVCDYENNVKSITVVCRDNNFNRKYNRHKELYNSVKARLIFSESLKRTSPYLELRCFF
mgnify:FL=1